MFRFEVLVLALKLTTLGSEHLVLVIKGRFLSFLPGKVVLELGDLGLHLSTNFTLFLRELISPHGGTFGVSVPGFIKLRLDLLKLAFELLTLFALIS